MAQHVSIEDCLESLPSRFDIVRHAAKRAREIQQGAKTTADVGRHATHKCTVLALKEIASGEVRRSTEEETMDALFSELSRLNTDDDLFGNDTVV